MAVARPEPAWAAVASEFYSLSSGGGCRISRLLQPPRPPPSWTCCSIMLAERGYLVSEACLGRTRQAPWAMVQLHS